MKTGLVKSFVKKFQEAFDLAEKTGKNQVIHHPPAAVLEFREAERQFLETMPAASWMRKWVGITNGVRIEVLESK